MENSCRSDLLKCHKSIDLRLEKTGLDSIRIGLILGTGMGGIADAFVDPIRIPYEELPGFFASTIKGHRSELIFGRLNGVPCVAMNGRCHFYEGRSLAEIQYPIRLLHTLGVKNLIIGNASGGVNPRFRSGEIMLIDQNLDMMFRTDGIPLISDTKLDVNLEFECRNNVSKNVTVYSDRMNELIECLARKHDLTLQRGVYAALTGPNYETRAEYRMLRKIGADVVGMSTIPEANLAAKLGLSVCGLSTITNVANPDFLIHTTHDEVIKAVEQAESTLRTLLLNLVLEL